MRHGGDLGAAIADHGGSLEDWLDLSTGINPHAYPLEGIFKVADWTRLPSNQALTDLITAARQAYRVPAPLDVAVAPGSQIIISLLPDCMPYGGLHLLGPTYSSHSHAWMRAGRDLHEWQSIEDLLQHVERDPAHVLIVNPNNPDGRRQDPQALLALADTLRASGHFLIVDEAFADCLPGSSILPLLAQPGNILVLRSLGKFYGLAGLRLGFLIGPEKICGALALKLESWSVSGPAMAIGTRALADRPWQEAMIHRLGEEIAQLQTILKRNHLQILGSTPLYALAEHPDARALHTHLAQARIWTRSFDNDPTWLRFGLPPHPHLQALSRLNDALQGFFPLSLGPDHGPPAGRDR